MSCVLSYNLYYTQCQTLCDDDDVSNIITSAWTLTQT